jgi:putative transposase
MPMPRSARIVIPGLAHHVIQRGNRQQAIFFTDDDRQAYLDLLAIYCRKTATRCLAWCLMDNHVHLILIPLVPDGLRATLAAVHTAYSQRINTAQSASGHLFQGRFLSYPMDDAHLMVALRYVENNPVKAGMVARAEDWRWSSARAHVSGTADGLTDLAALTGHLPNWRAMLEDGLEAAERIDDALKSGLPLGAEDWREAVADQFGRRLQPQKPGPKGKIIKGQSPNSSSD